jgi:hypothetical protein
MTALVVVGIVLAVLTVWQPLLLIQLLMPPRVDAGYHNSDQWLERRAQWWRDHPKARCRVSFLRAESTLTILGLERGGLLGWKPVVMQRRTKKLHLHEWLYPPSRRWRTPDWALTPLTPTAHRRLHKFDRWLWHTVTLGLWRDKRNRLLPVSSFLFIYGRYALPIIAWWGYMKVVH